MSLEDLKQRASDNYAGRLGALLDAIAISAEAAKMGTGAIQAVASELHYGANTVRKLAAMQRFPDRLINVDMKPGAYWACILCAEEIGRRPEVVVRYALMKGWDTSAKVKAGLGLVAGRDGKPPCLDCEAWTRRVPGTNRELTLQLIERELPEEMPHRARVKMW